MNSSSTVLVSFVPLSTQRKRTTEEGSGSGLLRLYNLITNELLVPLINRLDKF